ncbi:prohibitin family protein [Chelatococcus sp. GCM10030263]|uniref:prohibitin family protein n=1 Tax=Chelatococcus sp. GCM10030263 TaxID=3273387 RepID=UPI003612EC32
MTAVEPSAPGYIARRRRGFRLTRTDKAIATVLFIGLVALLLTPLTFFAIRPGEVGVLYHLFGGGTETTFVYNEGIGVKWPWNTIYRYEVRTQARDETINGLAADGLSVAFEVTVLYHPIPSKAGLLHREVGPDYAERLVRPVTTEAVRDVIGKNGPHDLYRRDVTTLEQQILSQLKIAPVGLIDYEGVIIRRITLPENLNQAITRKLTEEQNAQAYDFLIVQAEKEAARKRVEAIGIQTFYSIVANALSPQLLTWRGIEATVQIARSPNSKVVIVGGSKDQMPLILGSDIGNQPALPSPAPVNPNSNLLPNFDELPRMFPDISSQPAPSTASQSTGRSTSESASEGTRSGIQPDAALGTGDSRKSPSSSSGNTQ